MNRFLVFIIFSSTFLSIHSSVRIDPVICPNSQFPTVSSWIQACKQMPKNRDTNKTVDCSQHSPFFENIENVFDKFTNLIF